MVIKVINSKELFKIERMNLLYVLVEILLNSYNYLDILTEYVDI